MKTINWAGIAGVVFVAGFWTAAGALVTPDAAHAAATPVTSSGFVQLEPADKAVTRVKVTYAEMDRHPRRYFVELNNGALYVLRPCKLEDSANCFWDAGRRGNHLGRSFADIGGQTAYLARRVMTGGLA